MAYVLTGDHFKLACLDCDASYTGKGKGKGPRQVKGTIVARVYGLVLDKGEDKGIYHQCSVCGANLEPNTLAVGVVQCRALDLTSANFRAYTPRLELELTRLKELLNPYPWDDPKTGEECLTSQELDDPTQRRVRRFPGTPKLERKRRIDPPPTPGPAPHKEG